MLTKTGHNVTLLNFIVNFNGIRPANPPKGSSEIRFIPVLPDEMEKEYVDSFQESVFQSQGSVQRFTMLYTFHKIFAIVCEQFVNEGNILDELKNEQFNVTLSHFFTLCPVGINQQLKIPNFIWVGPGTFITDLAASNIGMSTLASYVPQYSGPFSDQMTFFGRLKNFCRQFISNLLITSMMALSSETGVFQRFPEENFPDLFKLAGQTETLLINGESFLDFPRPLLPNVLYMGDMEHKQTKKLSEEWQTIMDNSKNGVILFSLGTLANSSLMPIELKKGFLKAFSQFPDHTILWRLEGLIPEGLEIQKHIKIVKWIPQRDLLGHPKMKLFITHGGYNSLLETAQSGVPMILMPLFGDQYGNAYRAVRHSLGLVLDKFNTDSEQIAATIREVLTDDKLAEMLTKTGHNVTLLNLIMDFNELRPANPPKGASEIRFVPNLPEDMEKEYIGSFQSSVFQSQGSVQRFTMLRTFHKIYTIICEQFINQEKIFDNLKTEQFNVTLSHFFGLCPIGISQKLKIPNFIWVASGTFITDFAASNIGMSTLASYVPQYSGPFSDQMTFFGRLKNFGRQFITDLLMKMMTAASSEMEIFQRFPEEDFPNLFKLAGQTETLLINGESFLDFPRPLLPNVLYMGDMEHKQTKKLSEEWQTIMDNSKNGVILFSLGTLANSSLMPIELKKGFLKAFSQFPDHTILWRLEGLIPEGLEIQKHIKIVKWIPQRDLLGHPKMKLFITHGGYNSLLETAQSGVPMILMPLFGDQYGNAYRAVRHSLGLVLDKFNTDSEQIAATIREVLTDDKFQLNSFKFSSFLNEKLIPNEKHTLHTIEKTVRSQKRSIFTKNHQKKLNLFQHFCLDIIAFYITALFCIVLSFLIIVRKICNIIKTCFQ